MNLTTYLQTTGLNKAAFAREIGISSALLYQVENGIRKMPPKHCPAVEKATDRQVSRRDLRPDDWHQYWPELAEPQPQPQPQ
jgi:DNA-binding transcriptional regulator YdaS (Cro superfamily)